MKSNQFNGVDSPHFNSTGDLLLNTSAMMYGQNKPNSQSNPDKLEIRKTGLVVNENRPTELAGVQIKEKNEETEPSERGVTQNNTDKKPHYLLWIGVGIGVLAIVGTGVYLMTRKK